MDAASAAPSHLDLQGRIVWITGASRGLGRTLACGFAAAGAELLLTARSESALREVAEELRQAGTNVETIVGSIADPGTLSDATALLHSRWGKLHTLVNNAGISPSFVSAERVAESAWREVLEVNLTAPLACCRAALPLLELAGGASVVNVSSIHATRAHPRLIAYAASKGGLEMVTRTLAVEWASRGIRVNSVAPGYVETDMTAGLREHPGWSETLKARIPMGRFASAAEIAPSVLFLSGPGASYITGATLHIDGGWTAL